MKLLSDRGNGTPLILLCALMCDEDLFVGQADRLSRRRRVLILQSEGEGSIKESAAELLAMLCALGMRRFDLGGLSMGGNIAQAAVARCPSAVKRLILMDTRFGADLPEARAGRLAMIRHLEEGHMEAVLDEFLPRLLSPQGLRDQGERVRAMFRRQGAELFVRQLRMLLTREDMSQSLRAFHGPALCLCGAQDELTPPDLHRELASLLVNSRLAVIPGNCGHLAALESPRLVTEALEEFLGDK